MKLLAFAALSISLMGAARATPVPLHIDTPASDAACNYAYDHQSHAKAADLCLAAADDWASYAAIHQRDANDDVYSLLEIATRTQAGVSMALSGQRTTAIAQLSLAFDQAISVDKTTKYEEVHEGCVLAAKYILRLITTLLKEPAQ